jgi:NADPH-dependent curcumin reductase CurA
VLSNILKEGETVLVSGAAGAVGIAVGQLAKIKGIEEAFCN